MDPWLATLPGLTIDLPFSPAQIVEAPEGEAPSLDGRRFTPNALGHHLLRNSEMAVHVVVFEERWLRTLRLDTPGFPPTREWFMPRALGVLANCAAARCPGSRSGRWVGGVCFGDHGGAKSAGVGLADIESREQEQRRLETLI